MLTGEKERKRIERRLGEQKSPITSVFPAASGRSTVSWTASIQKEIEKRKGREGYIAVSVNASLASEIPKKTPWAPGCLAEISIVRKKRTEEKKGQKNSN